RVFSAACRGWSRRPAPLQTTATSEDHHDTAEPVLRPVERRIQGGSNPASGVLASGRCPTGSNTVRIRPGSAGRRHPHALRSRGDVLPPQRPPAVSEPGGGGGAGPRRLRLLSRGTRTPPPLPQPPQSPPHP